MATRNPADLAPFGTAGGGRFPQPSGSRYGALVEPEARAGPILPVDGFVRVDLIALPLDVWQRTQEHVDGLLREFTLIVQDAEARAATPRRLLGLVQELNAGYGKFSQSQRVEMEAALGRGDSSIDLSYQLPPAAAGAARALGDVLDEADDYCRRGDHLLTLATPPEELRFRQWLVDEFVDQIGGAPPTPWPDYPRSA